MFQPSSISQPRRIGLFGGTFDPVHLGHLQMAEAARDALFLDEVRFLPCRISPHKSATIPTAASDRLEMLRRATWDFPWAVVDDFEILREGPSFSWQTAEAMKLRFPEARLFWIMGTDQWDVLPTWAKPERLAACVEFIVFARGKPPEARDGYVMHVVEGIHPASATEIREAIAGGRISHPWLDPHVTEWVRERGLYRRSGDF